MVIFQITSSFVTYICIYLLGGLTLLPGIFITVWYFSPSAETINSPTTNTTTSGNQDHDEKKGWIRLMEDQQPTVFSRNLNPENNFFLFLWKNSLSSFSFSYFVILRHGTLFCYDNEKNDESTCQLILPIHDYIVSLYANDSDKPKESELYGRATAICLTPKNIHTPTYYLTCQRASDKEDWYFALLEAARFLSEDVDDPWQHLDWRDSTMYDSSAMAILEQHIMTPNNTPPSPHAWWHAILGRLFLGIYKTDTWRDLWHTKLQTKLDKLNIHLLQQQEDIPSGGVSAPLELQHLHMGDTIPYLTSMTLDTFDSDGHCVISGQFDYDGKLEAVLRIDLSYLWPFSTTGGGRKSSTTGGLVLTIQLRHCSGKMIFKVKPPPSNRIWVGFASMPTMDWQVTVCDKQIKWSVVTHWIQAKIKDLVKNTLVVPNMEDVPFFDSDDLGGIFGERRPILSSSSSSTTTTTAIVETNNNNDNNNGDQGVDANEKQQGQQQATVSKLVQGYINRIKVPHKITSISALHSSSSPKTT